MDRIKAVSPPGMTLIGFKPRSRLEIYYNIRSSYFIYPDEKRTLHASQLFDALIKVCIQKKMMMIVKISPKASGKIKFAALIPQKE